MAIFQSPKKYFSEAEFFRKIPEIPQKERFLPNFRLRNLKIQSPKNCNSIPPAIPYPPLDSLLKRHININFLLWLASRCPWDKRLVVPGLTGPESLCFRLENTGNKNFFPLVNRRVVPGLSRLSTSLCFQSLCAFLLP